MTDVIASTLYSFCKEHIDPEKPLLLAVSGGADSICLLHGMLSMQKAFRVCLHIVHIDHGWRKESVYEAKAVKALAEELNIPCHIRKLHPEHYTYNKEDASRNDRLSVFKQVAKEVNAQAVLLGHHAGDLEETVLKRVFEGASLPRLYGIKSVVSIDGLCLMRPLLFISKQKILEWLASRGISYFEDLTNHDPIFLRSRMRDELFPFLQKSFGKCVGNNLLALSKETLLLHEYLEQKTYPFFQRKEKSDLGWFFDLSKRLPDHQIETQFFIKEAALQFGMSLSRKQIEYAAEALHKREANKYAAWHKQSLYIDRGRLFFLHEATRHFAEEKIALQDGVRFGPWQAQVAEYTKQNPLVQNHWKNVWEGSCWTIIPAKNAFLQLYEPRLSRAFFGKYRLLSKLLASRKVPHILYSYVPYIVQEGRVIEDFLLGIRPQAVLNQPLLKISLKRILD